MLKIGLTGGIGSGKSTVARLWQEWGAEVINADAIAHEITAPDGAAIEPIRQAFGAKVINSDGSLNRAVMRQLVFEDPAQRKLLESITHPLINQQMQDRASVIVNDSTAAYLVFDLPLLVENWNKWSKVVDEVCVINADEATRIARIIARSQLDENTIKKIMRTQTTQEQRLAVATYVIDNGAHISLEQLSANSLKAHLHWLKLSA